MTPKSSKKNRLSRRSFLKCTGTIVFILGGGSHLLPGCTQHREELKTTASDGYLLVDVSKCQGCISCMLACSLVHEGVHNPTLSRIQILQDSFGKFPEDLSIAQCRQCEDPACVAACPEDALTGNPEFGHVRMVDKKKCTGCGACFEACPFSPARLSLSSDTPESGPIKARKCDLCANARFHWDEKGGGPNGRQACVETCPVGAIAFARTLPVQEGDTGYLVNLKGSGWSKLGYLQREGKQ